MAKVELVHVPYKGTTPAVTALLGNEVPLMLAPALTVLPHVNAGKARALAITSATRAKALPDLPTVAESGVPGYEANQWYGVMVPAGTPQALITRLNAEIRDIMRIPEVADRLAQQGSIPVGGSTDEFGRYVGSEIQKWAKVIRVSGASTD
jgi:tripartite-type tricarboxylate transporter receptor subunit TctC